MGSLLLVASLLFAMAVAVLVVAIVGALGLVLLWMGVRKRRPVAPSAERFVGRGSPC